MGKQNLEDLKETLYSEKSLSILNIRELRDMGRKFGVPSPTTKSKKELVDYILKIVYGEVEAATPNSYGRPSVREFDMEKYLSKIQKNSVVSPDSLGLMLGGNVFETKVAAPNEEYDVGEIIEQRVFVEENGKCYLKQHAFVETDSDIEIQKDLAKRYKLENFDMTEIVFGKNTFKIISINGIKIENKLDKLNIDGTNIRAGESYIFHCSTKEEIKDNITKIKNATKENKTKLFVFSVDDCSDEYAKTIIFTETEESPIAYKKLMQFVAICEKNALDGENFVMVIDRAELIEKLIAGLDEDVCERIKKHLRETILNILSYGNVLCVYKLEESITY